MINFLWESVYQASTARHTALFFAASQIAVHGFPPPSSVIPDFGAANK